MTISDDPIDLLHPVTKSTDKNHSLEPKGSSNAQLEMTTNHSRKYTPIHLPGSNCQIKSQVSMASYTSFKVGGPAQWYVAPRCLADLQASMAWAKSEQLPIVLLGAGSNLLIGDRGLPGLAIGTRYLRQTYFDSETGQVTADAGVPIAILARQLAHRGWQGLEWAIGIPGTVGGAVVMNAGAHKSCIADILVGTEVLLPIGKREQLVVEDLGYGYRSSVLQLGDRLVTQATFQLQTGNDPAQVMATTAAHLKQRHRTQPYHLPSCGSVFRNPEGYKAGWLIEQTGLKGYQIGAARVSDLHANFILNSGGATASDIFQLICYIQQQVKKRWSILLKPEVKMLGEFQLPLGSNLNLEG